MRTSRMSNRQSSSKMTVKKPLNQLISFFRVLSLNGVLHDVRKTPVFQGRAADERAVHVRLAHQFTGIPRLDAATILDAHAARNRLIEQFRDQPPDEGMGVLRLLGGGGLAGADGPDRLVSDDRLRPLIFVSPGPAAPPPGRKQL